MGLVLLDAVLIVLALYAGYLLRFDFVLLNRDYNQFLLVVPFFLVVRLSLFALFNLYRGLLRYASVGEMVAIFFSVALGTVIISAANLLIIPFVPAMQDFPEFANHLQRVPWPVVIIEFFMTFLLVAGARFSRRVLVSELLNRPDTDELTRVVVVGAGDLGEAVARQMRQAVLRSHKVVAFVDDDPGKQGRRIHGIPVAGRVADLPDVLERFNAQEVLIAMRTTPEKVNEIMTLSEHARVGIRTLPTMSDVFSGKVSINQIRRVEIEDLLGREPVELQLTDEQNYIRGNMVMITGAGGSIGSELCRQLLRFGPEKILLYGHGENSIYEISTELNEDGQKRVVPVIGDIRDAGKLNAVVQEFRPTIFFHAAAHKHVPLMEMHPDEAIKNNVTGTLNVARAAEAAGAKKFILISSDKAVRPTSVMGASKRVAEMLIFCRARESQTQFVAVRFGNVLGSRGSVIPLFKRQIARGGPITLTHPEITRFFMTIPEAVSLVIQAGSMQEQRRLYLLDMGKSVNISDLAKNLIRLSGLELDKDIKIVYTGLRPGEKLKEELLTAGENVKATGLGKIFCTEPDAISCDELWKVVGELQSLAEQHDSEGIRKKLAQLIPDTQFGKS